MPDQPDDAPKRPQRGVFPPFFAPRSGRGGSTPVPSSGAWRRVSRLFTPPDVTRQRVTPATPSEPVTPPSTPITHVPEASIQSSALEAPPGVPLEVPPEVPPERQWQAPWETPSEASATVVETTDRSDTPNAYEMPSEAGALAAYETPVEASFDDVAWPALDDSAEAVSERGRFDPMAFDEVADELTVEALAPEPIALNMSDLATMGEDAGIEVDAGIDMTSGVTIDAGLDVGASMDVEAPINVGAVIDGDAAIHGDARLDVGDVSAGMDVAETGELDYAPELPLAESDPWAEADLPEPAFGSLGWPSAEVAAVRSEAAAPTVDEMTAALGWSEADAGGDSTEATAASDGGDFARDSVGEDALSEVAHELRHSSSAWLSEGEALLDEEAEGAARARFYGGAEANAEHIPAPLQSHAEASTHAGGEAAAGEPIEGAGAAIADALARVASRIRSGEVELPSEAMGASDESALAAALAALLRGPRR